MADLDRAVTAAYRGIYSNMGEVCNAGSRLLVDRSHARRGSSSASSSSGKNAFKPRRSARSRDQHGAARDHGGADSACLRMIDIGPAAKERSLQFGGAAPPGIDARRLRAAVPLFTDVSNGMHDRRARRSSDPSPR